MLVQVRKRRGATVCRVTQFSPNSPWRKHGRDRQEHRDPEIVILDLFAHRPIEYGATVRVRKAGKS